MTNKGKNLEQEFSQACENAQRTVKPTFAIGGKERKDSVLNGLHTLPDDCLFVQVHDCARPLIRTSTISTLSEKVLRWNSIAVARPVRDTVRRITISNDSDPEEPQKHQNHRPFSTMDDGNPTSLPEGLTA